VLVEGIDTANEDDLLEVRRRVGMVFQNPDNQIVANVVEEDVAFALENLGVPSEEIRRRVDEALELVGMTAYVRHAPHLLSGGQKQRIAIAGVVAMQPKCIVLDEPTAMLDPQGRNEVLDTLEELNHRLGITVVLITHHMDEAARAQRLIVMHKGEIRKDGAPSQVFRDIAGMEELGLSVPETYQLLDGLRQAGWDIPMEGLSARDCAETITQFLEKRGQSIGAHH
jgi:energy-coupling factor transport system ATP-binding protein